MSDFWSRRKEAAQAEEAERLARAEAETAKAEAAARAAELEAMPEAELLETLGLPDPDNVRSGENAAAFMAKAVPMALRNRALRSLWRSNPVLANLDGLNDYDGDFTGNGLNGGVLKTSYEVGKGLAAHVTKMAEKTARESGTDVSDEKTLVNVSHPLTENSLDPSPSPVEDEETEIAAEEAAAPVVSAPARGMRFTFEEDETE